LIFGVELLAVVSTVVALSSDSVTPRDVFHLIFLLALGSAYFEVSRQVEQRRSLIAVNGPTLVNMSSVWTLAGALILPPGLACIVPIVGFLHMWQRSWRLVENIRPHRVVYNAATAVVCTFGVSLVIHHGLTHQGLPLAATATAIGTVLLAAVTYRLINLTFVAAAISLSTGSSPFTAMRHSMGENLVELGTLALGGVTAEAVTHEPWFAVLVLPAVFMLQHHSLMNQLLDAATVDSKTELLNAGAWRQLAERDLTRANRANTPVSVLVIDMDHFKLINDTHGHLAGDAALKAVGEALSDELRGHDAVGRFGGEEFVALLSVDAETAVRVAERIRGRIASLSVYLVDGDVNTTIHFTASVGVAGRGGVHRELDELISAADRAVYEAKRQGRNTVRLSTEHAALSA
jgi:diguanylate cyclase (GGDEF)-like protein